MLYVIILNSPQSDTNHMKSMRRPHANGVIGYVVDDDFCQQYLAGKALPGSPLILQFLVQSCTCSSAELPLHIQGKLHDHSNGSKFITSC
jgi:hypothetical protein